VFTSLKQRSDLIQPIQLTTRAAVSAVLAVVIARLLDFQYPIYALIAAVIVTDLSPDMTKKMGARRMVGSFIGAVIGAATIAFVPVNPFTFGLSIAVAMGLSYWIGVSEAARLAGYICGIIVLGLGEHPWVYAFYRLLETLLGVVIALIISFVPKLVGLKEE